MDRTMTNPEDLAALSTLRSADTVGGEEVVAAYALGRLLGRALDAEGWRTRDTGDSLVLYAPEGDRRLRVRWADFLGIIRERALAVLDEATDHATSRGAMRCRATHALLADDSRGATRWLRTAATCARDLLAELPQEAVAALDDARRAAPAPRASTARSRTDYARAARERHQEEATDTLRLWLGLLGDEIAIGDELPLDAAWKAFDSRRRAVGPALAKTDPGLARLGRTGFYRIVSALAEVRTVGGRARRLSIPYGLRTRALLASGRRVEALMLHRQRHYGDAR